MSTNKIYVDIQSLLDIRQSILIDLMGEEKALEYVSSDTYNFRETDNFPVDKELYEKKLNSKNPVVFKNATITYIEVVLKNKLVNLEKLNGFNSESSQPELVVNTYPYQLTQEQVRNFQNAVFVKLDILCVVTVVYDPPHVWSPSYIRNNNVSSFFMYDFTEWMKHHGDKLINADLRNCNVYFPSIGKAEPTTEELKELRKLGFNDVFSYTEYIVASAARIQFLPIVFYTNIVTATAILDKNKGIVQGQINTLVDEQKDSVEEALKEKGLLDDHIA